MEMFPHTRAHLPLAAMCPATRTRTQAPPRTTPSCARQMWPQLSRVHVGILTTRRIRDTAPSRYAEEMQPGLLVADRPPLCCQQQLLAFDVLNQPAGVTKGFWDPVGASPRHPPARRPSHATTCARARGEGSVHAPPRRYRRRSTLSLARSRSKPARAHVSGRVCLKPVICTYPPGISERSLFHCSVQQTRAISPLHNAVAASKGARGCGQLDRPRINAASCAVSAPGDGWVGGSVVEISQSCCTPHRLNSTHSSYNGSCIRTSGLKR